MERINIEEVYGEPIDENDTIFKLSNSGEKAAMFVGDSSTLESYKIDELLNHKCVDLYELSVRIANDRHEGKIDNVSTENEKKIRTIFYGCD